MGQQSGASELNEKVAGNQVYILMKGKNGLETGFLVEVPPGAKFTVNIAKDGSFELKPDPSTPDIKFKAVSMDDILKGRVKVADDLAVFDYRTVKRGKPDEALEFTGLSGQMNVHFHKKDFAADYHKGIAEFFASELVLPTGAGPGIVAKPK